MNTASVQRLTHDAKGGVMMEWYWNARRIASILVREHGEMGPDGVSLDAKDLSPEDKRLILRPILESGDVEEMHESAVVTERLFLENREYIQSLIDTECEIEWMDFMEESGLRRHEGRENGDVWYTR